MGDDRILRRQQHQGRVPVRVTVFSWRYNSWSKIKEVEDNRVCVHIRSGCMVRMFGGCTAQRVDVWDEMKG